MFGTLVLLHVAHRAGDRRSRVWRFYSRACGAGLLQTPSREAVRSVLCSLRNLDFYVSGHVSLSSLLFVLSWNSRRFGSPAVVLFRDGDSRSTAGLSYSGTPFDLQNVHQSSWVERSLFNRENVPFLSPVYTLELTCAVFTFVFLHIDV